MIKNFLKGSFWVVFGNVCAKLVSLCTNMIITRIITPAEYGVFSLYFSYILLITSFSNLGISIGIQRIAAQRQLVPNKVVNQRISTGLMFYLSLIIVMVALLFVFEDVIHRTYFNKSFNSLYYHIAIIAFAFNSLSNFPLDILIGFKKFKLFASRFVLFNVVSLVAIGGLGARYHIEGCLYGVLISMLANFFFSGMILIRIYKREKLRFDLSDFMTNLKAIMRDGFGYYLGNSLVGTISTLVLYGLLIKFVEIEKMGQLRNAQSIAALISFLPAALTPVTVSMFSSVDERSEASNRLKVFQLKFIGFSSIIITIVVICFMSRIITLLFGRSYGNNTEEYSLYMYYTAISIITGVFENFILSRGKGNYLGGISIMGFAIALIVSYILIPKLGLLGYIIGLIIAQIASLIVAIIIDNKKADIIYKKMSLSIFCVYILFMASMLSYIYVKTSIYMALLSFISPALMLYVTVRFVFNKSDIEDFKKLKRIYF